MQERMTTKLRRLLKEKDYLMAPCAYDALTAKCIEASGFDLIEMCIRDRPYPMSPVPCTAFFPILMRNPSI